MAIHYLKMFQQMLQGFQVCMTILRMAGIIGWRVWSMSSAETQMACFIEKRITVQSYSSVEIIRWRRVP